MAFRSFSSSSSSSSIPLLGLLSLFFTHPTTLIIAAADVHPPAAAPNLPLFREAPAFRNGDTCESLPTNLIHVAMTLDVNYIRGTMAAVFSILQHSTCPENVMFHFIWVEHHPEVFSTINSTFPYLNFNVYQFETTKVKGLISKFIRQALDHPLNYARIYLADILPSDVKRVIYLDSDLVVVDDILKLWKVDNSNGENVLAAPEYCHANFTVYFTETFWADQELARTYEGRKPCYFNTGVMVVDVEKWRQ